MIVPTPNIFDALPEPDAPRVVRTRDAESTRQLLLAAARLRFARNGYGSTTVRDIAADAGVNVALINRYFTSKEGLFEACLADVVDALGSPSPDTMTPDEALQMLVRRVSGLPGGEHSLQLLLLLRSSGDENADNIRRTTLRSFAERLAVAVGWSAEDAGGESIMLRAQIALSAALGIVLLRSSTRLEPLASATQEQLIGPLGEVISTLLSPSGLARA